MYLNRTRNVVIVIKVVIGGQCVQHFCVGVIKTKIVLELIKEDSTLGQLASKYEVSSKTIQNWKNQFLTNAALAFEPAKVLSEYQEQINNLKEQNDELAKALGKTTVERDWAMGKLQSWDLSNKKSLL